MTNIEHLRQNLHNSLVSTNTPRYQFSKDSGVNACTISYFLNQPTYTPHPKNIEKIEAEMRKRGWMQEPDLDTRPAESNPDNLTDCTPPVDDAPEVPDYDPSQPLVSDYKFPKESVSAEPTADAPGTEAPVQPAPEPPRPAPIALGLPKDFKLPFPEVAPVQGRTELLFGHDWDKYMINYSSMLLAVTPPDSPEAGTLREHIAEFTRRLQQPEERNPALEQLRANPLNLLTTEEKFTCIRTLPVEIVRKLFPRL